MDHKTVNRKSARDINTSTSAEQPGEISTKTARDIMTTVLLTAHVDWSLPQLAEFLLENGISGAPVVDHNNKLIGVVSETDIVRYDMLPVVERSAESPPGYYLSPLDPLYTREDLAGLDIQSSGMVTVGDLMTPVIFEVSEAAPISEIAQLMVRGRIHRVFVTQDDKISGLVTTMDIVAQLI